MDHNVLVLMLLWAASVLGLFLVERSALMPHPKLVVQGLVTAVLAVSLYLLVQRIS